MADNVRVATCGDCIHADVCVRMMQEFRRDNPAYCKAFKGKDKLVEVVRCSECKYASPLPKKYIGMYEEITLHCVLCRGDNGDSFDLSAVTPDQFCDEGERSEGE